MSTTIIKKQFSVGWFIFWLLVFWPFALIQVISYWCRSDTIITTPDPAPTQTQQNVQVIVVSSKEEADTIINKNC